MLNKIINRILLINFKCEQKLELESNGAGDLKKAYLKAIKQLCRYAIYCVLKLFNFLRLISVEPLTDNGKNIVVSLTTFPLRINNVWMVIYTLFNQTERPGKIVLNLTRQEFPEGLKQLPGNLQQFRNKGLDIQFVDVNLKAHNKYFYVLQQYVNRIVVTVDDDLLYCFDTIERLSFLQKKFPGRICANRVKEISFLNNEFNLYKSWELTGTYEKPSHRFCALGYAGVLYPASFKSLSLFDIDNIKKLCPLADDLWLKCIEITEDVKVVKGKYYAHPLAIPFSEKIALRFANVEKEQSGNDEQWQNLNRQFNLLKYFSAGSSKVVLNID